MYRFGPLLPNFVTALWAGWPLGWGLGVGSGNWGGSLGTVVVFCTKAGALRVLVSCIQKAKKKVTENLFLERFPTGTWLFLGLAYFFYQEPNAVGRWTV